MRRIALTLAISQALAACASRPVTPVVTIAEQPPEPTGWRAIASAADKQRLELLPMTWTRARAAVPRRLAAKMRAEGELVDPAAALELPAPPPGPYRCRLVRFGGRIAFQTFAPDFCYVDGGTQGLSFTKQTGENLPGGWIHADTDKRQVFLGAMRGRGQKAAPGYGDDPVRDMAGVVERVSPFRWRLVLARAGRGAVLDLYELVPVTPEVPGAMPAVPAKG